jgi:very-short-patch-repair endonuclease
VIVELDGRGAHDIPSAFDTDRQRDRILQAGGWRVARVTWRHLQREADELEADLRLLLRRET